MERTGGFRRSGLRGVAFAALVLLTACRAVTDENFGYVAVISPAGAPTVDVWVMGTYVAVQDSTGIVDRTGVPYEVGVWVGRPRATQQRLTQLVLTGTHGDAVRVSAFEIQPDPSTAGLSYIARGLTFPYTDYRGMAYFQSPFDHTVKDSVGFVLQRHELRRKVTFWQFLSGV